MFAVSIFQFAFIPALALAEVSEIVIDEDESMAAVTIPETYMFTGAAKHSIPIDVPPGRNGIQPHLSLKYNSFWKNGWIGVGWRLSESAIRRSTKRGIDFSARDFVFERNGQQTELIERNDWGSDYFGAKIESNFTKYNFNGASQGWAVTARDGTTYFYGTEDDSKQYDPADSNRVYKWCLNKVEDTNGNYMTFSYESDQGQIYLKQIDYTGNTNASVTGSYKVIFERTDRPDVKVSYKSRFAIATAQLLDRIEVYHETTLVRKYQLDYETGTSSGCSRLKKLQIFGENGTSLPATTFDWNEGGSGTFTIKGFASLGGNNLNFADLNGDGYTDAVARTLEIHQWNGGYSWNTSVTTLMNTAQWADNSGSKFSEGTTIEIDSGSNINDNSELAPIGLGDIDGDGFADMVTVGKSWISKGDGSFNAPIPTSTPSENIIVGDIDGDGLTDIVGDTVVGHYHWDHSITVYRSNGNGTFQLTSTIFQESGSGSGEYPEEPKLKPLHLADITGDGKADLIKEDEKKIWIYKSKGDGTFEDEYSLNLAKQLTAISFGDVNGDGLIDIVARCNEGASIYWNIDVYVYLSKGDGGFDTPKHFQLAYLTLHSPRSMSVGDVNGDGRADLVVGKSQYPYGVDTYLAKVDGSFEVEGALYSAPESADGIYLSDINGDGRFDLIDYRTNGMEYYLSDGSSPQPDLLSQINADTGATMKIDYEPSSSHYNPLLPFIFQIVSTITVNDGVSAETTTTYDTYSDGLYDYSDREFRGFRLVKQTKPDNSIVEKTYHQDDFRKGNEEQVLLKDPDENTLTDTSLTWEEIAESQPWGFVKLNSKRIDYYDNPTVFSQEEYAYNAENGYLHTVTASGDGTENITTITEYINQGDWVWRLEEETLKNSAGEIKRQTKYTYEGTTGNLQTKEQVLDFQNAGQNPVTGYGYDEYGNVNSITDPRGNQTIIEHDSATNTHPVKVTLPQTGCGTPGGCVDHVVEYNINMSFGKVSAKKDENGNWTNYGYDPFGRLEEVIYPDGGLKTIAYFDDKDQHWPRYVLTKIWENSTSTIDTYTYYDGLNRRIEMIANGEDDQKVVTMWRYDNMGRQDRVDGPFFSSQTDYMYRESLPPNIPYRQTTFDYRGRPVSIEQPLGNSVDGGGTALTHYAYSGFAVTVTDPDGSMQKTRRDYLDRIREVVEYTEQGEQHTYYDYNAAGDLTKVTNHLNKETNIEYDNLGRKTAMTDPDMGQWQYPDYDKNGNLIRQLDAKTPSQEIQFAYDELNRVTSKSYSTPDPPVAYTYDKPTVPNGIGRLCSVTKKEADESITASTAYDAYDEMGRVLSVTKTITGAPSPSYTTTYDYDLSGKVESMTYPDTYELLYEYHPGSELLYQVTGPEPDIELHAEFTEYEPTGKIGQVYYGNSTQTDYSYDQESNRLLTIQTKDTNLNFIQYRGYKYSPAGDIKQIVNNLSGITYTYTYDKLHRLTSETNDGATDTFAPTILENHFGGNAPLHTADNIDFNGVNFSYEYDENGNMTAGPDFTDPAQPAMRTITYNADNMPVSITHTKGTSFNVLEFAYNGESKRVKKVVNGGNQTYYIGEHFEVRNGVETKYIFAGNLRIAKITSSNRYFFHKDHLDSSTVITSYLDGAAVETTEYMPFGSERTQPGISLTNFKFTDQEWDGESGLYNYNARLYDPIIGRFVSADTIVPEPYKPQSLNRYSYCLNNPVKYVDPTGHSFTLGMAIGAVSGAVSGMIGGIQSSTSLGAAIAGGVLGGLVGTAVGAAVGFVSPTLSGLAATSAVGALTGSSGAVAGGAVGRGAVEAYTKRDEEGYNYEAGWEAATKSDAMVNDAIAGAVGGALAGIGNIATQGATRTGRFAEFTVGVSVAPVENAVNMLGSTISTAISLNSPSKSGSENCGSGTGGYGGGRGFGAGDIGMDNHAGGSGMGGV